MPMLSRRAAIIRLFESGKTRPEIEHLLREGKMFISRTLKRYAETGGIADKQRPGRQRTVRTAAMRKNVIRRIKRNPARSMRKLAKQMNTSRESLRRLVHNDLGMKSYKLHKHQLLTAQTKQKRLERSKAMLLRFTGGLHHQIVFSDEKLFTVEQSLNQQNHRILATSKDSLPQEQFHVYRTQKPMSVMVWAGVTSTSRTPLVFVPQGVKINQSVYRNDILEKVLKPWARKHFKKDMWIFQQDSAPAHRATATQEWCKANFPGLISSEQWPPCSPDLNPLDFSIWSILEDRVNCQKYQNLADLKRALTREWEKIPQEHIRSSVESFLVRLQMCVQAKGGIFE